MTELGVFAKYWLPGQIKTRLAKAIGENATERIYRAFLGCIADRFDHVADQRRFIVTPPSHRSQFERFLEARMSRRRGPDGSSGWQCDVQAEGDLGARIHAYFDQALASCDRVVLIGSDSPNMPRDFLDEAFELLTTHDVVVGPTDDGGYYLIGAAGATPAIFDGIDWSTDRVWTQTRERLTETKTQYAILPRWYDVDNADDLDRLVDDLRTQADEPQLQELLAAAHAAV